MGGDGGPVRLVKVEQKGRGRLQHGRRERGTRVGHVMQDTDAIAEVLACFVKRQVSSHGESKANIGHAFKPPLGDIERLLRRINAVQRTDARSDLPRPAPRPAAEIKPFPSAGNSPHGKMPK